MSYLREMQTTIFEVKFLAIVRRVFHPSSIALFTEKLGMKKL